MNEPDPADARPDLDPVLQLFPNVFDIPRDLLSPTWHQELLNQIHMNVPVTLEARPLPPPVPLNTQSSMMMDLEPTFAQKAGASVDQSPAHLPVTMPDTKFSNDHNASQGADILNGFVAAKDLDHARKQVNSLDRISQHGDWPILAGYTRNTGDGLQYVPEYNSEGEAVPLAEPTLKTTRAVLGLVKLELASGDPKSAARHWDFWQKLVQRSLEFIPNNDTFVSPESLELLRSMQSTATPSKLDERRYQALVELRADRLLKGYFVAKSQEADVIQTKLRTSVVALLGSSRAPDILAAARKQLRFAETRYETELAVLLTSQSQDRILHSILNVSGAFSEYSTRLVIALRQAGIMLSPEPDVFEPRAQLQALLMLQEAEEALAHVRSPSLERLRRDVVLARARLERWLDINFLPVVKATDGLTGPHWRERRYPAGIIETPATEPYLIVPTLTPDSRNSAAAAIIALRRDHSTANQAAVREWEDRYLKLWGVNVGNEWSGILYTHALGFAHELLSAHNTQLMRELGVQSGSARMTDFADRSVATFVNPATGFLRAALPDANGINDSQDLPVGDGQRLLKTLQGNEFADSPSATAAYLVSQAQASAAKPVVNWNALQQVASEAEKTFSHSTPLQRLQPWVRQSSIQTAALGYALLVAILQTLAWIGRRGDLRLWVRLLRDIAVLPLLVAPAFFMVFFLDGNPAAWATAVSWLISVAVLAFREGWAIYYKWFYVWILRHHEELNENQLIISPVVQQAANILWHRQVLGAQLINGSWVSSIDNPFNPGNEIGTPATAFLTTLEDLHTMALEYYYREGRWDGDINNLPPEVENINAFAREAGTVFRDNMTAVGMKSTSFDIALLYYHIHWLSLRQILIRPMLTGDGANYFNKWRAWVRRMAGLSNAPPADWAPNRELSDRDRGDVEQQLGQLGFAVRERTKEVHQAGIDQFAEERNLNNPIKTILQEIIEFFPVALNGSILFVFFYAVKVGANSPLRVIFTHVSGFSSLSSYLLIAAVVMATVGLLLSAVIFSNGRMMKELGPSWRAMRSGKTSVFLRILISVLLLAGIGGVLLASPGFLQGASPSLVGVSLPLIVGVFLAFEILALWMNRISFFASLVRYHGRPNGFVGSGRVVEQFFFQKIIFLVFGIWLSVAVGNFFQGYLVSAGTTQSFLLEGYAWSKHLIRTALMSVSVAAFFVQILKLKPLNPVKERRAGWRIASVISGISSVVVLGLTYFHPVVAFVLGSASLFVSVWFLLKRMQRPTNTQLLLIFAFGSLSLWGIVLSVFLYQPLGGFLIGVASLVGSLILTHMAIFSLRVALTSVARAAGRARNLWEIGIPMVALGMISGVLPELPAKIIAIFGEAGFVVPATVFTFIPMSAIIVVVLAIGLLMAVAKRQVRHFVPAVLMVAALLSGPLAAYVPLAAFPVNYRPVVFLRFVVDLVGGPWTSDFCFLCGEPRHFRRSCRLSGTAMDRHAVVVHRNDGGHDAGGVDAIGPHRVAIGRSFEAVGGCLRNKSERRTAFCDHRGHWKSDRKPGRW